MTTTACSCRSATRSTRKDGRLVGRAVRRLTDVVGTYAAVSTNGVVGRRSGMVSATTHQPQKEMFGNRDIPFQGDYNWVAIAD